MLLNIRGTCVCLRVKTVNVSGHLPIYLEQCQIFTENDSQIFVENDIMVQGQIITEFYNTTPPLHIQIRALRVALDEPLAGSYLVAHQHIEHLIGLNRLLDAYL